MSNSQVENVKKFDLEERLIDFASSIIELSAQIDKSYSGNHLSNQLVRSGTSPALQYGEAQAAESRNDFIHKIKILLKELRETKVNLRIILKTKLISKANSAENILMECDQLIAIFIKSVETAKRNNQAK